MAYKCLISRKKEKHKQPLPNFTEFTSFAYKNEQNNADLNNNEITQKPESNQDHHEISFSENTKSLEQNRKKIEKLNFKVIYVTNDLVTKNADDENYDFIFYDDIFYGLLSEYRVVLVSGIVSRLFIFNPIYNNTTFSLFLLVNKMAHI